MQKHSPAKEAASDKGTGLGGEWERFGFDSAAPLEEERDADADVEDADLIAGMGSADALGGADDLAHLDQIKSSFVFSSFSNRGATTQEAHENAIFGAPPSAAGEKLPCGQSSKASEPNRNNRQCPDKARRPSDQGPEERVGEKGDERRSDKEGRRGTERNERREERRNDWRDGQRSEGGGGRDRREVRQGRKEREGSERREGGRGRDERKEKEKEMQRGEQAEQQARAVRSGGGCAAAVETKFSVSGRKSGAASTAAPDAFTAAVAAALGVEEEDDEESVPVIVGLVVDTRPTDEGTRPAGAGTLQPHAEAVQDEVAGVPTGVSPLVEGLAGEAAGGGGMEGGAALACNGQQQAAARAQVPSWKQRALQLKAARAASQQQ
ncbi:unnamed protein product [Closterium sp. NIES-65]|nr:unnamed protein product [Closterium sp. NIES-65]